MKTRFFILAVLGGLMLLSGCGKDSTTNNGSTPPSPPQPPPAVKYSHPMLFLTGNELENLYKTIQSDSYLRAISDNIIAGCDKIPAEVKGRVLDSPTDKRILKAAREIMRRIFFLSYAYNTTHTPKYLERALLEMRSVAGFSDWNAPNHFLDVAELTMAMSVGYDWLYNDMTDADRKLVRDAIIDKGLKPSDDSRYNKNFMDKDNNWAQVCHASMAAGAIVTLDYQAGESMRYINRSVDKIKKPMDMYKPDGSYPEGADYWEYGTMFNVMLMDALNVVFKTDDYGGLAAQSGFMKTGLYSQQVITSTLNNYCYSDNNSSMVVSTPTMWFYKKTHDHSLLYMQKRLLDVPPSKPGWLPTYVNNNRYLPMLLIWAAQANASFDAAQLPTANFYIADGVTPVCVMRSGWENKDIYVGVKGGTSATSHSHMDQGSFILEAEEERWAVDLGAEKYANIEAQMSDFWSNTQNSNRWRLVRYGTLSHNTLTFSSTRPVFTPARQNVDAKAEFLKSSKDENDSYVTIDLKSVYQNVSGVELRDVKRAVAMINRRYVMVEDRVQTSAQPTLMQWRMTVQADPSQVQISQNSIIITKSNGKKLILKVDSPVAVTLQKWSTDPVLPYESANPGTVIVGYQVELPAGKATDIKTYLMPGTEVTSPLRGSILE